MTRFIDRLPCKPVHEFEVVNEWPAGYFVWLIGRENFPHPGYLPLATSDWKPYHVRTDNLKAYYVGDEGLCLYILRAAHYRHGSVYEKEFQDMKREYEARENDR